MIQPLLLCTDLDRTLIPNGNEPESPGSRERFRRLVAQPGVILAYVSGRDRRLVEAAIADYQLPRPNYVIGDVGTSLYALDPGNWTPVEAWSNAIGAHWGDAERAGILELLAKQNALRLQEPPRQAPFKLSYYVPLDVDAPRLRSELATALAGQAIRASLVWSQDELAGVGLLDIVPERATKRHAIEFLMRRLGHGIATTVFAGDSGNDLEVLASPIPAVLIANGHPDVRQEALAHSRELGLADRLHCARGGWQGMNGNYSAGILEGVAHFRPDLIPLMALSDGNPQEEADAS